VRSTKWKWALAIVAALIGGVTFLIWASVAQSWNLVIGVSGVYSFAQIALFAIGGWTTGVLTVHYGVSPWLGTLAAGFVTCLAGLAIGLPMLRLRGTYVVLLTIAFHELVRNFVINGPEIISGGGWGLVNVPRYSFPGAGVLQDRSYFYVGLVMFLLTTGAIRYLFYSPIGLGFHALGQSEAYAIARGVSPYRSKLLLFAVSAFLTGIAGAFSAHFMTVISPSLLAWATVINLLAMLVIGGWGSFSGPIIGAAVLTVMLEVLQGAAEYRMIAVGVALTLIAVFAPQGLAPGLTAAGRAVVRFLYPPSTGGTSQEDV